MSRNVCSPRLRGNTVPFERSYRDIHAGIRARAHRRTGNRPDIFGDCVAMKDFLSQFSGKKIGTPPRGSIHDVIVNELLREHGIEDITVMNYPWADYLTDTLRNGEIAAATGTPALAVTARRYGNARIVIPPDKVWPFNPSYGIIVMRQMLKKPTILARFLSVHEAGLHADSPGPGRLRAHCCPNDQYGGRGVRDGSVRYIPKILCSAPL